MSEWPTLPLGEICEINPPRDPKLAVHDSELVSFVPMTAVDDASGTIACQLARPFSEVRKGYTYFREGDVLFAKITPCMQNGKHAVVRGISSGFGFGSTEFHVLRPRNQVRAEWIHYFLRQPKVLRGFAEQMTGTVGQQRLPEDILARAKLPVPSLPEQQRIVAALNAQLAAAARARAAVAARCQEGRTLWHAALGKAFTPLMSSGPLRQIFEVAKVQSGYAFKSEWFSDAGIRLLRNTNISHGRIDWSDIARLPENLSSDFPDYELNVGDLVITMDRPLVSGGLKVARLTEDDIPALLLQRVGRFRLSQDILPEYLYLFLNSRFFIKRISGHDYSLGVPHISPSQIEAIHLPVPSLTEQQKLVEYLKKVRKEAIRLDRTLTEQSAVIDKLPAALLRQTFNSAAGNNTHGQETQEAQLAVVR